MNGLLPLGLALAYVAALFAMAAWAERRRDRFARPRFRRPAYVLALAVYCTSWTFFGAVGSAAADGWNFLPITLGPILVYLLAPRLLTRLVAAVEHDGATSISDFIGARFGKSRGVAALVTLLALFGTVPYLALQLRSVGTSFAEIAGGSRTLPMGLNAAALPMAATAAALPIAATAAALALFAIFFGTRRYSISGRSEAVLYAVAVESLVKLAALLAVAGYAVYAFAAAPPALQAAGLAKFELRFDPGDLGGDFVVITLLAMAAIVCLPRQFYIGAIEAGGASDVRAARWPFIVYLVVTTLAVLPITLAGLTLLPETARPDLFVLDLPLSAGVDGLGLLVFLGGFAAATGMVLVETIALSTMVSNDLVGPFLLRGERFRADTPGSDAAGGLGRVMLTVRRLAIIGVMGAALAYALFLPPQARLAEIGLIAFAAMAQFAPVLLLSVLGGRRDAIAAQGGLATGLAVWAWTLLLPAVGGAGWFANLAGTWAQPAALFGLTGLSPLSHGVFWSLGGNLGVHALLAARRLRAPLIRIGADPGEVGSRLVTTGALADMAARFAGRPAVAEAFGAGLDRSLAVDARAAQTAERLIAGVVGAPSARVIMASALSGAALRLGDVARMLDEGGQSLQFSKDLLAATLENIDPGVSVVDHALRLIAWNSRYLELFHYPAGMVRVGTPVADLIHYNAVRGECGPGEVDDHVARRLGHMRRAGRHSFERVRHDGRVIKTVGGPMRGGDIGEAHDIATAAAEARAGLEAARAELETRVAQRTGELRAANAALGRAAEEKTRFLAAASHDLLQPLQAARLFTAALAGDVPESARALLANVDRSIAAADALLRALLDISRLDAGGIKPAPTRFAVRALLAELVESFAPLAAEKQLRLALGPGDAWVATDRDLLRSCVQNFISNAVRYTAHGGIVVAARRRGSRVRIEVWDTGCGIAEDAHDRIFGEFERLGTSGEAGIGLGLAIVQRTARLLGAPIDLRSVPGQGSRFAMTLPVVAAGRTPFAVPAAPPVRPIAGLVVLVIDDDAAIRVAAAALLARWQCRVLVAADGAAALAQVEAADVALVDLDLGTDEDGLMLVRRLRALRPGLRCALITADRSALVAARAETKGVTLLPKPLDPLVLATWLAGGLALAAA